jgi:hypothetical protein
MRSHVGLGDQRHAAEGRAGAADLDGFRRPGALRASHDDRRDEGKRHER